MRIESVTTARWVGLSVACLLPVCPAPLLAQAGPTGVLEEIIVTAQKRARSAQDVPIALSALSALSAEDMHSRLVASAKDIAAALPNLMWAAGESSNVANIYIRGVGDASFHTNQVGAVGLFSDDPAETHDGNFVTRCVMEGLVDPEKVIQIGIRGAGSWAWEFSEDTGMRIVYAEEVARRGIQAIIAEAREIVGSHRCYLTLDVDAIEPTFLPATTVPEPFGLTPWDVRDLIRGVRGQSLVGADIVEISPPRDSQEISANLGAALAFELLCVLSEARLARTGQKRRTHWRT